MIYIIIPTYNRAHTLIRAIESAVFQDDTHCIIIDDGSRDNTKQLIDAYINKYKHLKDRISYFYKNNGGVSDACNYGIEKMLGISGNLHQDYVMILGSDDELNTEYFGTVTQDLLKYKDNSCFIFPMKNSDNSRVSIFKYHDIILSYGDFLGGQYIEGSDKVDNCYIFRAIIFASDEFRMPSDIPGGEWLMYHSIIKKYNVVILNKYIYTVNISENSMTRRTLDSYFYENGYRLQKKEIELFGEDLLIYNKSTLGYHYLILARYCGVLRKYKEGFIFFLKGVRFSNFDIARILLYIIANLPFSMNIINFIIKVSGNTIELSKFKIRNLSFFIPYKDNRNNILISSPIIENDEINAVVGVMKTGNIVQGNEVSKLEQSFVELTGKKYAIAVNSGTAAIHAGLYGLGVGEGDEVITSPFTFVASANPILMRRARVVFADINEDDYLINVDEVEKKITNKTKAVIPISLYGQVYDHESMMALADKYHFSILEDACQSVGAEQNGISSGACGDMGAFSLYATKNIMCGEGGILVTDIKEYADRVRAFRQHGMEVSGSYMYQDIGYNYRLPDMLAAIANVQFGKLKNFTDKRRDNAFYLTSLLKDIPGIILPRENPGNFHVFHQYTIRVTDEFPLIREDLMAKLQTDGIGLKIYYPIPIHLYSHFAVFGYKEGDFPVAEKIAKQVFSLPIHPSITRKDLEFIASRIRFYSQNS